MIELLHREDSHPCDDCGGPVQDGWDAKDWEFYYCPGCFRCYLITGPSSRHNNHTWPQWLRCRWKLTGESETDPKGVDEDHRMSTRLDEAAELILGTLPYT